MVEKQIYEDEESTNYAEDFNHRPKFSHLRIHFQVKDVYLMHNSINETKDFIINEISKNGCNNFNEYIFLDKEKNNSYTLFLGFRYDHDAYMLYRKNPQIKIPGKEGGEFISTKLESTDLFKFLINKKRDIFEKESEQFYRRRDDNSREQRIYKRKNHHSSSREGSPKMRVLL